MMPRMEVLPRLSSLGRELEPKEVGFVEPSNELLGDGAALRARLDAEGYLYFREFLDGEAVLAARREVMERLAADGLLDQERDVMEGVVAPDIREAFSLDAKPTFREADGKKRNPDRLGAFRPDLAAGSERFREVVFGEDLAEFYGGLFGERVRHFDYIWLRLMGPGRGTPTHCDWVYMGRGSRQLLTCWIPYGDIPLEVGGLMLLERSHLKSDRLKSYLEVDVDAYCENHPDEVEKVANRGGWSHRGWLSSRPDTLPSKIGGRWLTAREWRVGDFITFNMTLVHGSLDNRSDRVRLSTDTRWQPASEPADERWIGANPVGHSRAGKRGRIC